MSTAVRRALYGKLAGDTTLNGMLAAPPSGWAKSIYHERAPDSAGFPFMVFEKTTGLPTGAFGDPSALQTDVWLVKCVDRSDSADIAEGADARATVLLNDATLTIAGGVTHLYLRRESDVAYPEIVDGVLYRHVGGLFRLITD